MTSGARRLGLAGLVLLLVIVVCWPLVLGLAPVRPGDPSELGEPLGSSPDSDATHGTAYFHSRDGSSICAMNRNDPANPVTCRKSSWMPWP